jgi:predicted anti-sigma-YlaC factor YlaD
MAVNLLGDALSGSGATFASDDDPELIRAAVPFSLKLMESLLAENPTHEGLLLAAASGFTHFAYAFVQQDADALDEQDFAASEALRARARRLYLRAMGYGLRGLDAYYPEFSAHLKSDPSQAVARIADQDIEAVPLLYWTALSWAAVISLSKDQPHRIAQIPQMEALIDRALALDPDWNMGAIHTFLITYEMGRQGAEGAPEERARRHYERAIAPAHGRSISPQVAYAESVCLQTQDLSTFESMLEEALAIDPDLYPENRLVNLIMQQRAQWLLSHKPDLFLIEDTTETTNEP